MKSLSSTRPRVLHVATRFLHGGAERNIANWMSWEVAQGLDVEMAVGPEWHPKLMPDGVRVTVVKSLRRAVDPVSDLNALRELRGLVRGFDLVHTHLSKAGILGRVAARGIVGRIAHTAHMSSFGPAYSPVPSAIYRGAERWCAGFSDVVVFVGDELLRQYLASRVITRSQSMVIHSPIDVDAFLAVRGWSPQRRHDHRLRAGIPAGGSLAVSIGSLEPRKRHDLLIEKIAPWLGLGNHLAIAGSGSGERLLELSRRLGVCRNVVLLGQVDDVPALMAASDVVVHTSAAEGVAQVVIQALAAGRPVVGTEAVGLHELGADSVVAVPSSGRGLAEAVQGAAATTTAVSPDAFTPWTVQSVTAGIAEFHARLGTA